MYFLEGVSPKHSLFPRKSLYFTWLFHIENNRAMCFTMLFCCCLCVSCNSVHWKFSPQARKHILEIHTREWNPKLSEPFVEELAEKCVGKADICVYSKMTDVVFDILKKHIL